MIDLTFHVLDGGQVPGDGELLLVPGDAGAARAGKRQLALLALERGVDGFRRGHGAPSRFILPADPTLDDMLAAAFLSRLVSGETLPPGCRAFALYAAGAREGLRCGTLPLQESLEGIYAAIRHEAGADLSDKRARAMFLADWERLAQRILQAAHEGKDPATAPLFAADPEFARARTYLAQDREVYRQQDVPRGQRWRVQLPDGPPQAGGMLLRMPRSLLWKHWAYEDAEAPGGHGYLFLAVYEQENHWRFSTNPVLRVPIRALAAALQAEEDKLAGAHSVSDPWYDGNRHDFTLVAAPWSGTRLSEPAVLRLVGRWAGARPVTAARFPKAGVAAGLAAALLLLGLIQITFHWPFVPARDRPDGGPPLRGKETSAFLAALTPRQGKDYALLIATDDYAPDSGWDALNNPVADAHALAKVLRDDFGFETKVVENPTRDGLLRALDDTMEDAQGKRKVYHDEDQLFLFIAGHGDYRPNTEEGFIVSKESVRRGDPRKRWSSSMPLSQLKHKVERHPCRHVFLALDLCHAGTIVVGQASPDLMRGSLTYANVPDAQFVARTLQAKTRKCFTSCGINAVSDGEPGKHSPFTHKLLESLRQKDKQVLTLDELWQHVSKLRSTPRRYRFLECDEDADFLFIRRGALANDD